MYTPCNHDTVILEKFRDWYINDDYLQSIEKHSITKVHISYYLLVHSRITKL